MQTENRLNSLLVLVFGILMLTGCSNAPEEKVVADKEKEKEEVAVPVEIARVSTGDISAVYTNTTSLEAEQEAIVVAKTSEIITEIFVEEGDLVEKGQVLAQLKTDQQVLELKQAQVNLKRLKAELDRNKRIFEKKMVSSDIYEKLKYDYEAQQAAYELAKLQLEYATIVAPIDGVVSERMVKVGNMVTLSEPLFRITDFDPLHAVIHVPEQELSKLTKGMPALVGVDARKDEIFNAHVLRISPIVDANSGTFKVTVEVRDPERKLKPGMFGRVGIVYANHKDTILVDKNALIAEEEKPSVYVVSDNKASKVVVTTGFENSQQVEIIDGLKPGDKVVIAGQNSLKEDSKVEVLNDEQVNTAIANISQS
ncbi:efflux RND transporter periplasmic adaptor subunit [Pleionea sediminis]|uniref:efflux RND transporter periplasmic adaptor subunit n=1 Tax=Pleionea sediminis TaxID=2569479 RepID=UPI001185B637|nr:efflux RND transporter periplasmic adaptor subunit [Pleionea sediminis]